MKLQVPEHTKVDEQGREPADAFDIGQYTDTLMRLLDEDIFEGRITSENLMTEDEEQE